MATCRGKILQEKMLSVRGREEFLSLLTCKGSRDDPHGGRR